MNKLLHFGRIPGRRLFRPHLCLLVLCALGLAVPHFHAQQTAASSGPPANLDLYLLIGGAKFLLPTLSGVRYYDTTTLDGGHLLTMLTNGNELATYLTRVSPTS